MNRRKSLIKSSMLFILCALVLTPNAVRAQERSSERSDPMAIYREAGATKEEQAKIKNLAKEFEAGQKVKLERINNLLKRMSEAALEPDPDESIVLGIQDELNSTQTEMANARIKLMLAIRGTLTADHKIRLTELMKQRRSVSSGGGSMSMDMRGRQ